MIELDLRTTLFDSVCLFMDRAALLAGEDRERVTAAFFAMSEYHGPQLRKGGQLYVIHPIQAATLLLSVGADAATVSAALLHDTVEDTHATHQEVAARFGEEVARLVDAVSRDPHSSINQFFDKALSGATRDIRVACIKLSDQITNFHNHDQLHFSAEKHLEHLHEMESMYLSRLAILPGVPAKLAESAQRVTAASWEDYHNRSN